VSALSYYLEREGLLTTGISLVRENTESMQPPRALWVTFPLGRPLGKPGDAAFQLDVIVAALDLLDRSEGPVLEDYPHDAPAVDVENAAACPVSFAKDTGDDGSWKTRLSREVSQLKPWYELSLRRRGGRTLVGIADQPPEQNIQILAEHLDEGVLPTDITWLKRAVEDIKAYYTEAMTAQPGDYDSGALQAQFWQETTFGAAILAFYHQFQNSDDDQLKLIARILAPREAIGGATGPEREGWRKTQ
jgi:D-proline reductase (dithiol) PrdB